jgi:hypothetical protein
MRTFETGAVRDSETGKADYVETISWTAFGRYADYMTGKKTKYGEGNFKKGIPIDVYEKSMVRHIQKYLANKYEGSARPLGRCHGGAVGPSPFLRPRPRTASQPMSHRAD